MDAELFSKTLGLSGPEHLSVGSVRQEHLVMNRLAWSSSHGERSKSRAG